MIIALAGCGAAPGEDTASESTRTPSGAITLRITDSPADFADHVFVQLHGVQFQKSDGSGTTFYFCAGSNGARDIQKTDCVQYAPLSFDLLALTDGVSDIVLGDQQLDAGKYSWIRLLVDAESDIRDSFIVMGGAEYGLTIPGGAQSGLKLVREFDVDANGSVDFTIDFDLRKSIAAPKTGTEYILRPALRLVESFNSGAIAGTVDASWMAQACNRAVIYVFSGAGVTPDDIDKIEADPVASGRVKLNILDGTYTYKIAFLEPGSHTAAFLCQGALDDPDKNDALTFTGTTTVEVKAGLTTALNFSP